MIFANLCTIWNQQTWGYLSVTYKWHLYSPQCVSIIKLEGHSVERMYLRRRCFDGWVNKTILKPRLAAASGRANTHTWHFPDAIKFRVSEKAIRLRHPDYNPYRAQELISSSMSRHLSTHNISSKSMHAFLSNLANRQTDRQMNTGINIYLLLCRR